MKSKSIVIFLLVSLFLGACAAAPQTTEAAITSMAILSATSTETPRPMATITATPQPEGWENLSSEQQANLTLWRERLGDNFELHADGSVWDVKTNTELTGINWLTNTRTYEWDGNPNFTIPLDANNIYLRKDADGIPTGEINFVDYGWMWNGEQFVKKEFQGEPLLNILEAQAILANEKNVDLSKRTFTHSTTDPLTRDYLSPGAGLPIFKYNGIEEAKNQNYWVENIILVPNDEGGFNMVNTSAFYVSELNGKDVGIVIYWGSDGQSKVILLDNGNLVPNKSVSASGLQDWIGKYWSQWYLNNHHDLDSEV